MVEGTTTVTVSVISGGPHTLPECEMDALLLGRTKVSCISFFSTELIICLPLRIKDASVFRMRFVSLWATKPSFVSNSLFSLTKWKISKKCAA